MVSVTHKPGVGYQPFAPAQPKEEDVGFGQALAPAFRLENDVYALAELMSTPQFEPDSAFDIRNAIRGSEHRLNYFGELARAQSQEEFNFISSKISRELKDKQLLASAGIGGFMAGMLAGTLSPTMAVPLVGPARGVKGAAQAFALAFGASTAQEAALFLGQETRTTEDVAIGIAAGTVLGGLLGSGSVYLRGKARERVEADMALGRGDEAISYAAPPSTLEPTRPPEVVATRALDAEIPVYSRVAHVDDAPVIVFDSKGTPVPAQVSRSSNGELIVTDGSHNSSPLGSKYSDLDPRTEVYQLQTFNGEAVAKLQPEELVKRLKELELELAQIPSSRQTAEVLQKQQDYVAMLMEAQRKAKSPVEARSTQEIEDALDLSDEVPGQPAPEVEGVPNTRAELETFAQKADNLPDPSRPTYGELEVPVAAGRTESVGAAANPARAKVGPRLVKRDPVTGAVINAMARLNPVTRQISQKVSNTASYWMARLADAGLLFEGNATGVAQAAEGTVQSRSAMHVAALGKFVQEYDNAYARHVFGADAQGVSDETLAKVRSGLGRLPEGKMSWEEFGEVAYNAANTGATLEDPSVTAAVSAMSKMFKYYRDVAEEAFEYQKALNPDAARLFDPEGNLGPDVMNYVHHIFNTVEISNDPGGFMRDIANNTIENSGKSFRKSTTKFRQRYGQLEERLRIMELDESTAAVEIAQLNSEIDAVNSFSEMRTHNRIMQDYSDAEVELDQRIAEGKAANFDGLEMEPDEIQALKEVARADLKELRQQLRDLKADRKEYTDGITKEVQDGIQQVAELTRRRELVTELAGAEPSAVRQAVRELDRLEDEFLDRWRGRGATDIDWQAGEADFTQYGDEMANALFERMTGLGQDGNMLDILHGDRGPELARTLQMPYDMKRKWLHTEPEFVMRRYARQMSADVEIYRATGSPNGKQIFDDVKEEFANRRRDLDRAKFVKKVDGQWVPALQGEKGAKAKTDDLRIKANKELTRAQNSSEADLRVAIQRLRHQRGQPDNPNGLAFRAARVAADLNVVRLMGTVVPSSLADVGRAVMKRGLISTFRNGYAPFISDLTRVKMSRAEARRLGTAWDPVLHNRAQAVFDMFEDNGLRQSALEKGTGFLANKTGAVALFDRWTAEQKFIAAQVGMADMSHSLRVVAEGGTEKELKKAVEFLSNHGIEEPMAKRIWKEFMREGGSEEFGDGFRLPNTEAWSDYRTAAAFRQAIVKFADDTIVTPGLDRPSWMDANAFARLVAQFRSFTFTANNRILLAGLQQRDMALVNGVAVSLAMGALSYYTWAVATGGDAYDEMMKLDLDKWADESIARSGLMGVFTEGQRIAEQVPYLSQYATFSGTPVTNRRPSSIISSVAGPSYDLAERVTNVALGLNEPTQSTVHQLRTLMAYQNVFYFRRVLDQVEEGVNQEFNIPAQRSGR